MKMVEVISNGIANENPQLINSLERSVKHRLIRNYSNIAFNKCNSIK